jgi:hypothetical protein
MLLILDVVFPFKEGGFSTIPHTSALCAPLSYPLIFPHGTLGWTPGMQKAAEGSIEEDPAGPEVLDDDSMQAQIDDPLAVVC